MINNTLQDNPAPSTVAPGTASVVVDSIITGTDGDDDLHVYHARYVPRFDAARDYGRVLMYGNGGNDRLVGSHGNDVLSGGSGDDVFTGGYGNDIIDGGTDSDTVNYSIGLGGGPNYYPFNQDAIWHFGFGVEVHLDLGYAATRDPASAEFDRLISIENAVGTHWADVLHGNDEANRLEGRDGSDFLFGWNGADYLIGGEGNDVLSGGTGDDVLEGGQGLDFLQGNAGNDFASYLTSGAGVTVDLVNGIAQAGTGADDSDTLVSIESARGSMFADQLIGNAEVNRFYGYAGDDMFIGSAGADVLDGGADIDTVDYRQSLAVQVNLAEETGAGGDAAGDVLFDIENVLGSAFGDTLLGSGWSNALSGNGGADTLRGLGGRDVLTGGAGADVLDGGEDEDSADYSASNAAVTINLATGTGTGGEAAGDTLISIERVFGSAFNDTLRAAAAGSWLVGNGGIDTLVGGAGMDGIYGGIGNDRITGNGGADRLVGDEGADSINGGAGDDNIEGGLNGDILTGGTGADTFVYMLTSDSNAAFGTDTIRDFALGIDTIDLEQIDAILNLVNVDNAFTFIGTSAFTAGASGQLRFQNLNGNTLIQGETNGMAGVDFEILLSGTKALTAADFIL